MSAGSQKWLIVAAVVAACSLHAALFYLRWHHNSGASVEWLMVSFWSAVILFCVALKWIKGSKWHLLTALLLGGAALLPSAETSISWTIWGVMGFIS